MRGGGPREVMVVQRLRTPPRKKEDFGMRTNACLWVFILDYLTFSAELPWCRFTQGFETCVAGPREGLCCWYQDKGVFSLDYLHFWLSPVQLKNPWALEPVLLSPETGCVAGRVQGLICTQGSWANTAPTAPHYTHLQQNIFTVKNLLLNVLLNES